MILRYCFLTLLLLTLFLSSCRNRLPAEANSGSLINFNNSVTQSDTTIESMISPYRFELNKSMGDTIGYLFEAMTKARPEGKLGNICSRMLFDFGIKIDPELDLAIMNHGGLRAPLPSGPITTAKIYELMPFDNEVVILKFPSNKLNELGNLIATKGGDPIWMKDGSYLKIVDTIGFFTRFTQQDTVTIITSDYLANGGDNYNVLAESHSRVSTTMLLREVFLQGFAKSSKQEPLKSELIGIVQYAEISD